MIQQSEHSRPTAHHARIAERDAKRRAYQAFVRNVVDIDIFSPTARSISECLNKARLSEDSATSAELSRRELRREAPEASVPEELSEAAVSAHLTRAANLYAVAATKYVRVPDLSRAFRYFRRAANLCARAAESQTPTRAELLQEASKYKNWAAIIRQEHARKSLRRRRLSLGLLRRRR